MHRIFSRKQQFLEIRNFMQKNERKSCKFARGKVRPPCQFFRKNLVKRKKWRISFFYKKEFSTFENVGFVENFLFCPLENVDNWQFLLFLFVAFHISHNQKCGKVSFRHFWTVFTKMEILGKKFLHFYETAISNIFANAVDLFVIFTNVCKFLTEKALLCKACCS